MIAFYSVSCRSLYDEAHVDHSMTKLMSLLKPKGDENNYRGVDDSHDEVDDGHDEVDDDGSPIISLSIFPFPQVFDFSSGQMTQAKAKHLKDSMCNEFSAIFQLCQYVMDNSNNPSLAMSTLETLLRFLNWIPLGYIFETKLISTLIYKFLAVPMFRNVSFKCLAEIAAINVPNQYDEQFSQLFRSV